MGKILKILALAATMFLACAGEMPKLSWAGDDAASIRRHLAPTSLLGAHGPDGHEDEQDRWDSFLRFFSRQIAERLRKGGIVSDAGIQAPKIIECIPEEIQSPELLPDITRERFEWVKDTVVEQATRYQAQRETIPQNHYFKKLDLLEQTSRELFFRLKKILVDDPEFQHVNWETSEMHDIAEFLQTLLPKYFRRYGLYFDFVFQVDLFALCELDGAPERVTVDFGSFRICANEIRIKSRLIPWSTQLQGSLASANLAATEHDDIQYDLTAVRALGQELWSRRVHCSELYQRYMSLAPQDLSKGKSAVEIYQELSDVLRYKQYSFLLTAQGVQAEEAFLARYQIERPRNSAVHERIHVYDNIFPKRAKGLDRDSLMEARSLLAELAFGDTPYETLEALFYWTQLEGEYGPAAELVLAGLSQMLSLSADEIAIPELAEWIASLRQSSPDVPVEQARLERLVQIVRAKPQQIALFARVGFNILEDFLCQDQDMQDKVLRGIASMACPLSGALSKTVARNLAPESSL